MKTLNVGIIASGFTGQKHADALRRIPGIEVAAISDPFDRDLKEKAGRLGISRHYSDYKQMAQQIELDVIHNCSPNDAHFEISKFFIENGTHVYSEKPLSISVADGEALAALAARKSAAAAVNFNYRNNAVIQEMRERIAAQSTGKVFLVHGTYLQDWLMLKTDYNWRLEEKTGGPSRAVADIGSHWFDTVQVILGKRITAVNANLFTAHPYRMKPSARVETFSQAQDKSAQEIPIYSEDAGFIMMRFEDNTNGVLVLSQVSGGYKNAFQISVDCENYSMLWLQEDPDKLILGDRSGRKKTYASSGAMTGTANSYALLPSGHPMGWNDALYNGIKKYYDSIFENTYSCTIQPYATFADGVYIMKIVDACLKSNEASRWITVDGDNNNE